jgi:hypothetical protein
MNARFVIWMQRASPNNVADRSGQSASIKQTRATQSFEPRRLVRERNSHPALRASSNTRRIVSFIKSTGKKQSVQDCAHVLHDPLQISNCRFKIEVPLVVEPRPAEHGLVGIAWQLQFSEAELRPICTHIHALRHTTSMCLRTSSEGILPSVVLPPYHVRFQRMVHEVYRNDTSREAIMRLSSSSVLQQLQQLGCSSITHLRRRGLAEACHTMPVKMQPSGRPTAKLIIRLDLSVVTVRKRIRFPLLGA